MADTKLSALTELAAGAATDDEIYIRDISEASADESKRMTISNLLLSLTNLSALGTTPAGTDELLINDGGTIKKITADDFMFGDASTPSTQAHSDSAATGSAIEAARIDHKHAMPAAGGGTEATQSDMEDEGTSNANRFVSPEVAKFAPSAAKFWLDLDGDAATATIAASYNVSSVTDSTTGTFVVNLSTAFSSTRWACVMGSSKAGGGNTGTVPLVNENKGSNTATILVRDNDDDTALIDAPEIYFAGFGDQA